MAHNQISFHAVPPDDRTSRAIMLAVLEEIEDNREHLTKHLGEPTASMIMKLMEERHVNGRYKEFNLIHGDPTRHGFEWILLMGLGNREQLQRSYRLHDHIRSVVAIAARHFRRKHIDTFAVDDFADYGVAPEVAGRLIAEGAVLGTYRFKRYKSPKTLKFPHEVPIRRVYVFTKGDRALYEQALARGRDAAMATCMARDLVNTPAADLTPLAFANEARALAEKIPGLTFRMLDKEQMEKERMHMHLAVARGSDNDPCVVMMEYAPRGADAGWDLGLIGKGVTFDSGGYNLKPTRGIRRMYGDMGGAAAVLGAIRAIAAWKLPINVVAVMGLTENLVNGRAYKPGDILRSRKGLTVEITNTDAEGRLVLADVLDYTCETYGPRVLVDAATLTGAIVVALGSFVTGLFTHGGTDMSDDEIASLLTAAGHDTGEWLWRLPVDDDYKVQLSSDVADLENAQSDGGAGGGSIVAAVFLKQFIDFSKVSAWAHLDIAATALMERTLIYNKSPYQPREGGTGIGVRLMTRLAEILVDRGL